MKKKVTIECGFEEACLIERALDIYSRIAICQFERLADCGSLQKLIWDKDISDEFDEKAYELKAVFGLQRNASYGIFNKKEVSDDARIAAHLYQQFRHERYLDRTRTGEQAERHYTVDEFSADICQIANMPMPNLNVKIESNDTLPKAV